MSQSKYFVVNENTLCAQQQEGGWLETLSGSVIRGGRNPLDGSFPVTPRDVLRPATAADFADYRVALSPRFAAACAASAP